MSVGSAAGVSPRGGTTRPPDVSKPAGEIDEDAIIDKIKKSRFVKRKVMVQKKKVFSSELKEKDDVSYFLIENDASAKAAVKVIMDFKLDGFKLDNGDEDCDSRWTIPLEPGEQVLRVVRPEPTEGGKGGGGGMGMGMGGGMMGLMMDYAACEKGFTYKVRIL